ncbi:hypothetical protein VIAQ111709_19745 [Vibrio aquimaris]|uniref:Uncharacterized protein n=2 Tax=Vibrio aquimaris TaxID=2587862 RepID=A0A5P9CRG9_9VIBR|nr:hypothetical protein FIV01_20595 [Vibrio aquimaris]
MLTQIKAAWVWFKWVLLVGLVAFVVWKVYDYGVTKTALEYEQARLKEVAALQEENDKLFAKLEKAQDDAFALSVAQANQKPIIQTKFKTVYREVRKYAQDHRRTCIVDDPDWLRIQSSAVKSHNEAIQAPETASGSHGATSAAYTVTSDADALGVTVDNIQTCAETATRLKSLQDWVKLALSHQ